MTKYIVVLIVLIAVGGLFLYTTQTAQAPVQEAPTNENPFGEGATQIGTVDTNYTDTDKDGGITDNKTTAVTGATTAGTGSTPVTSGITNTDTGAAGTPVAGVISRADLAKHNTQADCWIGYKGTVYDVTNWLPRHPGSAGAIAPFCGTADEFASAFNKQHGTSREARLEKEGVKEGTLGN